MYVIIGFSDGTMREGIVLAAGSSRMRIALRHGDDPVELRRAAAQWKAEDGSLVELESVIYSDGLCQSSPLHAPFLAA